VGTAPQPRRLRRRLHALAEALGELLTGDVKLKNAAGHNATVIVTR
jgi:hypothetical protein